MKAALYILEINPFSVLFAIIFSHFEGYLLILMIVSFAMQKTLSLFKSHLFIFVYFHYCRRWDKEILLLCMLKCVLPVFSSKSFIVSGLMFKSLIHFEFIVVYGVKRSVLNVLFCIIPYLSIEGLTNQRKYRVATWILKDESSF